MHITRRQRADSAKRSEVIRERTQRAREAGKPCAMSGCHKPTSGVSRFCSRHTRARQYRGAADPQDVLTRPELNIAKRALWPVVQRRLSVTDPVSFVDALNGQLGLPEMDRRSFQAESKAMTRAAVAAHLRTHLLKRGLINPADYTLTVLAAKGAYALKRDRELLGRRTEGWTDHDHDNAWRVVAGRHLLRRQTLLDREVSVGVVKQMTRDLEARQAFAALPLTEDALLSIFDRYLTGRSA